MARLFARKVPGSRWLGDDGYVTSELRALSHDDGGNARVSLPALRPNDEHEAVADHDHREQPAPTPRVC